MDDAPRNIKRYSLFPKTFANSVEPLLKPIYKKHGFAEHRILTQWHEIVGHELAACSIPQKLSASSRKTGATLHILVASGRALELQHMQPLIMDRIAVYFGYNPVSKITFTQTSSEIFRKKNTAKPRKQTKANAIITSITDTCDDQELRNALKSLGNAMDIQG